MPSPFETLLPRELRDQIYTAVLPSGKLILPAGHAPATAPGPNLPSPALLTVNRGIYAEAVASLYATNTVSLLLPTTTTTADSSSSSGDDDDEAQTTAAAAAMEFWRRVGPLVQHVRVDLAWEAVWQCHCSAGREDGMAPLLLGDRLAAELWMWEGGAAVWETVAKKENLQTLTLDLNGCVQDMSQAEARRAAVIGLVKSLRGVVVPGRVILHFYYRRWFKGGDEVGMERKGDVGEVGDGGVVVKHLVIRGLYDPWEEKVVQGLCGDMWSMTQSGRARVDGVGRCWDRRM